jgi:hypothetical protein
VTKRRFLHISGAGRTDGTDNEGLDGVRGTTATTGDSPTGEGGTGGRSTGDGGTGREETGQGDRGRTGRGRTGRGRTGRGRTGRGRTGAGGTGAGISRRVFLVRGSLAAGAAAAVGSVPGLGNLLSVGGAESPEVGGMADDASGAAGAAGAEAAPEMSEPLVAHVINASTGEINLYQGTNQIVARDPGLAQAIARLAASRG